MSGQQMNLQTGSHYQLIIHWPGFSEPERVEVEFKRREQHEDDDVFYFVGPDRFHVGIPNHLIGSDFEIESI